MKQKLFSILFLLFIGTNVYAQSSSDVRAYIARYKDIALRQEQQYRVPASITLAQGILESGAGTSGLTRNSNNHFGIKGSSSWKNGIYKAWDDEPQKSSFRCYPSAEASYEDHARLLCNSHYQRFVGGLNVFDYVGWAYGLKRAGYATAPNYAEALIGYIDAYQLYALNGGSRIPVNMRPIASTSQGRKKRITKIVKVRVDDAYIEEEMEEELADETDLDESNEEFNIHEFYKLKRIDEINGISATRIYPGETLASVARRYDISIYDLMKFNDISIASQMEEGDIVLLAKKKAKYEGPQDYHYVMEGETIHSISQKFGIRKDKLMKLNGFTTFTELHSGQKVILK